MSILKNRLKRVIFLFCFSPFIFSSQILQAEDFSGRSYEKVKNELLEDGWEIDESDLDEKPVYPDYPEISCGAGSQAICSAGFMKGSEYHSFVISKKKGQLIIEDEY